MDTILVPLRGRATASSTPNSDSGAGDPARNLAHGGVEARLALELDVLLHDGLLAVDLDRHRRGGLHLDLALQLEGPEVPGREVPGELALEGEADLEVRLRALLPLRLGVALA